MVFVEQSQRRIPVQYAKRMVGRRMYGGSSTYIPIKINMAGVIPVIFASSLLAVPGLSPSSADQRPAGCSGSRSNLVAASRRRCTSRSTSLLIIFFCFFYTAITFNPDEVADNMKKYGGFIPGIRAGRPTAEYLDFVITRITSAGALYLALIALIPTLVFVLLGVSTNIPFGGTLDPHHRRRRAGDGQADRLPAAAAPLRRVPPLSDSTPPPPRLHARPDQEGQVTRLVILGPPGAGKGTQAARLAEVFGIVPISTGDIFRANIEGETELGKLAQEYTDKGELVPDEVTNAMVRDRLAPAATSSEGFILDGYPRNVGPGGRARRDPRRPRLELDGVIELTADRDELAERLAQARAGRGPGGRHRGRHRGAAWRSTRSRRRRSTAAYAERGLLVQVDGIGEIDEVTDRIVAVARGRSWAERRGVRPRADRVQDAGPGAPHAARRPGGRGRPRRGPGRGPCPA